MRRFASRLVGPSNAEDLVQEALARAWVKFDSYSPDAGSPSAWLLAIIADQSRKMRRRRRVTEESLNDTLVKSLAMRDSVDVNASLDLLRAIGQLAPRQRLAIDCHYFIDLTVEDTAVVMGCSVGTVKSTLFEARARLQKLLETT
jgi:RNA polymerase sigma-70 factor (ECF subfamily)